MSESEVDAFSRLVLEHKRTLFMLYGHRKRDGRPGKAYFKHAYSLSQAVADLDANEGVLDEGGFLVRDAFVEQAEDDVVVHVELVSLRQLMEEASEA